MEIGAVITKARDMYCNDDVIFPEQCGVTEDANFYWVEAYLRVPKSQIKLAKDLASEVCKK